jgi:TonB-dependent SusC/RagA subfamily outer membrane receptor
MKKTNKITFKYVQLIVFLCSITTSNLSAQSETTDTVARRVHIAYGSMDKRDVTAAISTVNGDELKKNTNPSIDNALVGRLSGFAGFPISYETGAPSYNKYIRGLKTTSDNNAPLLLIDNIAGDFSQLNVEEIETVTALKDAAALALYGSRGANGVILVTTKRGRLS